MNNYKFIAFDLDGTLLTSNKQLTINTVNALKQTSKHMIVSLSTGRCLAEIKDYTELFTLPYFICMSGAMVIDMKKDLILYENKIDNKYVNEILELTKHMDLMIHVLNKDSVVEKHKIDKMEVYHMDAYKPMYKRLANEVDDIFSYCQAHDVYKLNLYCKNKEDREYCFKQLRHLPLTLTYSEETSLEINALNVSKGKAIQVLCKYLNIDINNTIGVGDGNNDIDMLDTCGYAAVMDNASDTVKQHANIILLSNDNEGCADFMHHLLFESKKNTC